jgi:predicted DNA-binding transcriptional regulator AlpA
MSDSILMSMQEVSDLLGIPINTLKDHRAKGRGPQSAVVGGRIKYRRADVLTWVDERFAESAKGANVDRMSRDGRRNVIPIAFEDALKLTNLIVDLIESKDINHD